MPSNKVISTRRKRLRKTWKTPEWKKAVKEFCHGKKCEWCGSTEKLTAHHKYINSYKDGTYINLYLSGCMVLCNRCHFALHKGLVLCPKCGVKYMRVGSDVCYGCFLLSNPDYAEQREKSKEVWKKLKKDLRAKQSRKFARNKSNKSGGTK